MLTVATVVALIPSLLVIAANAPGENTGCAVVDSIGRCLVSAVDPGRTGTERARRPKEARHGGTDERTGQTSSGSSDPPEPPPPPPPVEALPIGSGWSQGSVDDLDQLLAEGPEAPADAAIEPSPEVLARRAVRQLDLPAPSIHTSGDDGAVVGVPLWLWVDRDAAFGGPPLSATAAAGGARVTAEARFSGIEWSMGPPGALVRCDGPGTPWTGQEGPSPDCGYTYRQRSLDSRTSGTGRWQVVATAVWSVTWAGLSAGAPVTGEQELRVPVTTTLPVGEVQVLVAGEGP